MFWASLAVLLMTWGVVPINAGIFAVRTITLTTNTTFDVSTSYIPAAQQPSSLTYRYGQSTYGILILNETLPPFMAHNYTLAPFQPRTNKTDYIQKEGTWQAATILYSLDLHCEQVFSNITSGDRSTYYNQDGCSFIEGLSGNSTIGETSTMKSFVAQYVGFYDSTGNAPYSLNEGCPMSANHTFFAAYSRNKVFDS